MASLIEKYSLLILLILLLISTSVSAQDPTRFQGEVDALFEKEFSIDPSKQTVVFTGSSSIRMWNNIQEQFPSINAINTGFGGSQFSDLIYYRDELIFKHNPDKIFIYEGDNDIAEAKNKYEIFADATTLLSLIKEKYPEVTVYFISPKPSIARWSFKKEYEQFNAMLKNFCDFDETIHYVDAWNPMLDVDGNPMNDIFIEDNLHMNDKGYEIWKEVIRNYID